MAIPRAYLDTCIVSGLAKSDLKDVDRSALLRILQDAKAGKLDLVTSEVTATELERIPDEYKNLHEVIYNLLLNVPSVRTHRSDSGLTMMGVGGGSREDPLFGQLKQMLPDLGDAEHTFQAAMSKVEYLITVDGRSFLRFADEVSRLCEVRIITPPTFVQTVLDCD